MGEAQPCDRERRAEFLRLAPAMAEQHVEGIGPGRQRAPAYAREDVLEPRGGRRVGVPGPHRDCFRARMGPAIRADEADDGLVRDVAAGAAAGDRARLVVIEPDMQELLVAFRAFERAARAELGQRPDMSAAEMVDRHLVHEIGGPAARAFLAHHEPGAGAMRAMVDAFEIGAVGEAGIVQALARLRHLAGGPGEGIAHEIGRAAVIGRDQRLSSRIHEGEERVVERARVARGPRQLAQPRRDRRRALPGALAGGERAVDAPVTILDEAHDRQERIGEIVHELGQLALGDGGREHHDLGRGGGVEEKARRARPRRVGGREGEKAERVRARGRPRDLLVHGRGLVLGGTHRRLSDARSGRFSRVHAARGHAGGGFLRGMVVGTRPADGASAPPRVPGLSSTKWGE